MTRYRASEVELRMSGSGVPVMLLHGIGGAAESFEPQLTGLAERHRVIAWDAPGYGGSADLPGHPVLDAYAEAVVHLLEELEDPPAHLVGVSWGGVIATRVALKAPDLLRSLVLAGSTRGSGRTAEAAAAMAARVDELAAKGPGAFAAVRGPGLLGSGADPVVAENVVSLMSRVRLQGYRNAARVMAATDHSTHLSGITVPALVLVGSEDRVTGVGESRFLARQIPGAQLVELTGAGHAANQEAPDAFNAALLRFFAEVDDRGGHGDG